MASHHGAKKKKKQPKPKPSSSRRSGAHGIRDYGVLRGKAVASKLAGQGGGKPHYQIHVQAAGVDHRIAVNVMSDQFPSELLFFLDPDFAHPVLDKLPPLAPGFTPIAKQTGGLALDFIRGNLFPPEQMKVVPLDVPGQENDLHELFDLHVQHAIARGADVYAFGSKWGPERGKPDQYFGFEPGNGIHDIHMNQGSIGQHAGDNGVWQDGGLFLHFADEGRWLGFFLAFQSQSFHTDDATGNAIKGPEDVPTRRPGEQPPGMPPGEPTAPGVSIVAALVNPRAADAGLETVTLLNLTADAIDLTGWSLRDSRQGEHALAGPALAAGEAVRVHLAGTDVQLSNQGDTITLLDPAGLKVHGVSFTREQAAAEGWSLKF